MDRVDVVQPVLWAVMVSLAGLWGSCGVRPVGGGGSFAGGDRGGVCGGWACRLEDAARVVALRSRVLAGMAGRGGMVSVRWVLGRSGAGLRVGVAGCRVAAVNGPGSVVVSGEVEALEGLLRSLRVGVCGRGGSRWIMRRIRRRSRVAGGDAGGVCGDRARVRGMSRFTRR